MQRDLNGATPATRALVSPGVKVPPPVIYALALGPAWGAQQLLGLPAAPPTVALGAGIPVAALGLATAALSIATLLRGRGTMNTNAASKALVTGGVYRFSRNPMYVALALMYSGAALLLNLSWALLLMPLLLVYTQRMVIAREEAFLADAFGQQYTSYAARVRRWL